MPQNKCTDKCLCFTVCLCHNHLAVGPKVVPEYWNWCWPRNVLQRRSTGLFQRSYPGVHLVFQCFPEVWGLAKACTDLAGVFEADLSPQEESSWCDTSLRQTPERNSL